LRKLLLALVIALYFFSCTKDKPKDWVLTNTQFLTAGVWHFSNYDYEGGILTQHITYADLPACRQDDEKTFLSSGQGESNEGPTKCNPGDPQSTTLHWLFMDQYAHLIEINGTEYYIDQLDDHQFKYHLKNPDPYASDISYGYIR
jgi:hypothetical protein